MNNKKLEYAIICEDVIVAYAESLKLATIILKSIYENYDHVVRVCIERTESEDK